LADRRRPGPDIADRFLRRPLEPPSGGDDWVQAYFYRTMGEIYWDLGVWNVADETFDEFLNRWKFR
jgi:hypothetical protein